MIVAMPDPDYGERACAFVVPSGAENTPDVNGLMEFLVAGGLARYKCPERIEFIEEFPVTDSGKPSKPLLQTMIKDTLKQDAAA